MIFLQLTEYGNTSAVSTDYESFRFSVWFRKLNTSKQGIKKSIVDLIQLLDHVLFKNIFRLSKMRNSISLYADDLICNFLCQIDFVKRHDNCDLLLFCHIPKNG